MQQQPVPQYIPGAQAPQAQAAPVVGVAAPTAPGGAQPGGQSAVPQQWQQRMVAIARPLEQTIPGYQIMSSVLQDLTAAQPGAAAELLQAFCQALAAQAAAVGSVRRFLCGEAGQPVLASLAANIHRFAKAHGEIRPHLERAMLGLSGEQRTALAGLTQTFITAETQINQAGSLVQSTVGPQVWEAVRVQVWEAPAPAPAPWRSNESHQPPQPPQFPLTWPHQTTPSTQPWWQQLPSTQPPPEGAPQDTITA